MSTQAPAMDPDDNTRENSKTCQHVKSGNCDRKHYQSPHVHSSQQIVFCHDYQNTDCSRKSCRFLHYTIEEEEYFRTYGELPIGSDPYGGPLQPPLPPPPPPPPPPSHTPSVSTHFMPYNQYLAYTKPGYVQIPASIKREDKERWDRFYGTPTGVILTNNIFRYSPKMTTKRNYPNWNSRRYAGYDEHLRLNQMRSNNYSDEYYYSKYWINNQSDAVDDTDDNDDEHTYPSARYHPYTEFDEDYAEFMAYKRAKKTRRDPEQQMERNCTEKSVNYSRRDYEEEQINGHSQNYDINNRQMSSVNQTSSNSLLVQPPLPPLPPPPPSMSQSFSTTSAMPTTSFPTVPPQSSASASTGVMTSIMTGQQNLTLTANSLSVQLDPRTVSLSTNWQNRDVVTRPPPSMMNSKPEHQSTTAETTALNIFSFIKRLNDEHSLLKNRIDTCDMKIAELSAQNDYLYAQNAQLRINSVQCSRIVNPVSVTNTTSHAQQAPQQVISAVSIAPVQVQATPIVSIPTAQTQIIANSTCTPLTIAAATSQGQQLTLAQQGVSISYPVITSFN